MAVQNAISEGPESSGRFSRKEVSFPRDLRTLGVPKFPMHSSTISDPEVTNETNSASKNVLIQTTKAVVGYRYPSKNFVKDRGINTVSDM